jgi:hypothetical protein
VIGDAGLRAIYPKNGYDEAGAADGTGAKLLVREAGEDVRACIYYPDEMIRCLEQSPPQRGLNDDNVEAFAVLVEELDHFLVAAERAYAGRGVSLLELEIQANVSKDLVLSRFLTARGTRIDRSRRVWLRGHLFHGRRYSDADPAIRNRYDEATHYALRFLQVLERTPRAQRLPALRRFHRASMAGKMEMIEVH